MKERIARYAPNAKFVKLHTGLEFNLSNVTIDIVTTHEDMLPKSPFADDNEVYDGMNETSTIIKMDFDGQSVLFLADCHESNGEQLKRYYPQGLSCTFLQAAHHLINEVKNIYDYVETEYVLIPQSRYSGYKNLQGHLRNITNRYGFEKVYFAGDCTQVFYCTKNNIKTEFYSTRGYVFDNSDY